MLSSSPHLGPEGLSLSTREVPPSPASLPARIRYYLMVRWERTRRALIRWLESLEVEPY